MKRKKDSSPEKAAKIDLDEETIADLEADEQDVDRLKGGGSGSGGGTRLGGGDSGGLAM